MFRKFPITINPLFWLFAAFIGWTFTENLTGTIVCMIVVVISLIVHEAGHALTAKAFGQDVRIHISFFGGVTLREGPKLSLWKEFLIVLAGPAAGFALWGFTIFLGKNLPQISPIVYTALVFSYFINLYWTLLNLIPVGPLDGGRLLSIVLESIFGVRGVKAALYIGVGVGIATAIFAAYMNQIYVAILFVLITFETAKSIKDAKLMTAQDRDFRLQELFDSAQKAYQNNQVDESLKLFDQVRRKSTSGILHYSATEAMAQILKNQGRDDEAYNYLKDIKESLSTSSMPLYHELAAKFGDYPEVVRWGHQVYQIVPTAQTAYFNALAHAALAETQAAIGWLECAMQEGMDVTKHLDAEPFDRIRSTPEFQKFVQRN
ncbi:MAG: site-2 protease family protein [Parachlamydiales bacterium]|nr:site-2 protease family protein [Parachlamydiales bacterium]